MFLLCLYYVLYRGYLGEFLNPSQGFFKLLRNLFLKRRLDRKCPFVMSKLKKVG